MANTLLSATAVTREALRVLHQKLNFVGSITREYDSSFAKDGAKIGDRLKIRLPNEYSVRSGAPLQAQDTVETTVDLKVQTQKLLPERFACIEVRLDGMFEQLKDLNSSLRWFRDPADYALKVRE